MLFDMFVSCILASFLTSNAARQAVAGCLGSRLTHRNAGTEFLQKNFSAAGRPFAMKYARMISILVLIRSIGDGFTGDFDQPAAKTT
jgi:hypothetical protein